MKRYLRLFATERMRRLYWLVSLGLISIGTIVAAALSLRLGVVLGLAGLTVFVAAVALGLRSNFQAISRRLDRLPKPPKPPEPPKPFEWPKPDPYVRIVSVALDRMGEYASEVAAGEERTASRVGHIDQRLEEVQVRLTSLESVVPRLMGLESRIDQLSGVLGGAVDTLGETHHLARANIEQWQAFDEHSRRVEGQLGQSSAVLTAAAESARRSNDQIRAARTAIEELPGEVAEYDRILSLVWRSDQPVPGVGGWRATTRAVAFLVDEILSGGARSIVECGSGQSTLWLAAALAAGGEGGHVYSLEHDPKYGRMTQSALERAGLSEYATVLVGDLFEQSVLGASYRWYESSAIEGISIDLLFVDGPPGSIGPMSRYPALPLLSSQLHGGSLVVLDDAQRADERAIVDGWQELDLGNLRIAEQETVDRAVVFRLQNG